MLSLHRLNEVNMKKSNNFKKKVFGSILGLCSLTIALTPMLMTQEKTFAEAEPYFSTSESSDISVKMYDHSQSEISSSSFNVIDGEKSYSCYSTDWKDLSHFKIAFSGSIDDALIYNYKYTVTWTPAEIKDGRVQLSTDRTEKIAFIEKTTSVKDNIIMEATFFIDDLGTEAEGINNYNANEIIGNNYIKNGGWGVYQFEFTCQTNTENQKVHTSTLFEAKPTKISEISAPLEISAEVIRSQYSIDNAYLCKIKGADYKYINRNLITWKVKGQGADGKNYVLQPNDIPIGDKTTKSLLSDNSDEYSTNTFKFDFDLSGEWEIWCEIANQESIENPVITSNALSVSTIKTVPQSTFIWIIIGAVAVSAIILTIIILVSKRKERIW